MSETTHLTRVAARLHTAAQAARAIAAQREISHDPSGAAHAGNGVTPAAATGSQEQAASVSGLPRDGLPAPLNLSVPHPARVYSCWLGGKDHFPADRQVAEAVVDHRPQVVAGVQANREFLVRVTEYLARDAGIRQFLDVGAGLPAPGATHEVAQAIAPQCRVVYADHDPLVVAHARAGLTAGSRQGAVACVEADLRDPDGLLAAAAATLDLSRPVAVLLLAVLHFVADREDPARIVAATAGGLAAGSFLAVSHLTADFAPEQAGAAVAAYNAHMPTQVTARTHAQVSRLFGDLPLIAPGVVPVSGWRPRPYDAVPRPADLYAGLARTLAGRRP